MYHGWSSINRSLYGRDKSVLHGFFGDSGTKIVHELVADVTNCELNNISSPENMNWIADVLLFGIKLPLNHEKEKESDVKKCAEIYMNWLNRLTLGTKNERKLNHQFLKDDPNTYAQLILRHIYYLFVSHQSENTLERQDICKNVIEVVEKLVVDWTDEEISRSTYECVLQFFLSVANVLLAPPVVQNEISLGLLLRNIITGALFRTWALVCNRYFPSPPFWKTFRELCSTWRHHEILIKEWDKINVALLIKLLPNMFGDEFPLLNIDREKNEYLHNRLFDKMSEDCVKQCFFRFLHILSNPVDLSHPEIIGKTPEMNAYFNSIFAESIGQSSTTTDIKDGGCLDDLPNIYHLAICSISRISDAFLGINNLPKDIDNEVNPLVNTSITKKKPISIIPDKSIKSKMKILKPPLTQNVPISFSNVCLENKTELSPIRAKVNSIMNLLGAWLIEASTTGIYIYGSSNVTSSRHPSLPQRPRHASASSSDTIDGETYDSLTDTAIISGYEAGRAEACGALCRIFSSARTGEIIIDDYLARFYLAIYYGLLIDEKQKIDAGQSQVIASIIYNSADLFRIGLKGVTVLLPKILSAIEIILSNTKPALNGYESMPLNGLRKASINILLSVLAYPIHFRDLQIKDIFERQQNNVSFISLKKRMIVLVLKAIDKENNSVNCHLLLSGLIYVIQDLALAEETDGIEALKCGNESKSLFWEETDTYPQSAGRSSSAGVAFPDHVHHKRESLDETKLSRGMLFNDLTPHLPPPMYTFKGLCNDSAQGIFSEACKLVTYHLINSWKNDVEVSMAAIECLSSLSAIHLSSTDEQFKSICKHTILKITEYIDVQCKRPRKDHQKNLHSVIVAAFHCLNDWSLEHSYLLADNECLKAVMGTVELGVTGKMSVNEVKKKDIVDPFPVSMRVRDAAEGLLSGIMSHVGHYPQPTAPESICSLLDENSMLKWCHKENLTVARAFKFFVLDGCVLLSLLEQALGNDEEQLPTLSAIFRGTYGRYAWTLQLRHVPKNKKSVQFSASNQQVDRPTPVECIIPEEKFPENFFPESLNEIPTVDADESVPPLEDALSEAFSELASIERAIKEQEERECNIGKEDEEKWDNRPFPDPNIAVNPPEIKQEFQTVRLFLSHFGFLAISSDKNIPNDQKPNLVKLDPYQTGFLDDLKSLDKLPTRSTDTLHCFYMKSGQRRSLDILGNVMSKEDVDPVFIELLHSLGWPVNVNQHSGWTGNISNSFNIDSNEDFGEDGLKDSGGAEYDGKFKVLYWANASSELAIIVPSKRNFIANSFRHSSATDYYSYSFMNSSDMRSKQTSVDFETIDPNLKRSVKNSGSQTDGIRVLLVWVERYEDCPHFPLVDLLDSMKINVENIQSNLPQRSGSVKTSTTEFYNKQADGMPIVILFVHPLTGGLFRLRISLKNTNNDKQFTIPISNGMVASRRSLGKLVRQTVLNICRRKRIDSDSKHYSALARRQKLKEITEKYQCKMSKAELYTSLFKDSQFCCS